MPLNVVLCSFTFFHLFPSFNKSTLTTGMFKLYHSDHNINFILIKANKSNSFGEQTIPFTKVLINT